MRNMNRQAVIGQAIVNRRPSLDITAGELVHILGKQDILEAVIDAYLAGLAVGIENARPTDPENNADFPPKTPEEKGGPEA